MRGACDHPSLVTSSLSIDKEAIDNRLEDVKPEEPDEADELVDLLGGLGVAGGKKCEVCYVK